MIFHECLLHNKPHAWPSKWYNFIRGTILKAELGYIHSLYQMKTITHSTQEATLAVQRKIDRQQQNKKKHEILSYMYLAWSKRNYWFNTWTICTISNALGPHAKESFVSNFPRHASIMTSQNTEFPLVPFRLLLFNFF